MRIAASCLVLLLAVSTLLAVDTTGRVVGSGGKGVVLVEVNFLSGGRIVGGVWTDDYGYFTVNVDPGTYTVVVEDPASSDRKQEFPGVKVNEKGELSKRELRVNW